MFIRLSKIANGLRCSLGKIMCPAPVSLVLWPLAWPANVRLYVAAGKSGHCTWPRPAIHDKTDSLVLPSSQTRPPPQSVCCDQLCLPQVRQANAVLCLLDLALAADRPQAHAVQGLLVTHDRADEHGCIDHGAELGAQQLGSVRVGERATCKKLPPLPPGTLLPPTCTGTTGAACCCGGGSIARHARYWPVLPESAPLALFQHHRWGLATLGPPLLRVDALDAHVRGTDLGITELFFAAA